MRQRWRLSPRDWLGGDDGRDAVGGDEGAGCGRDTVGGGTGLLGRAVGASIMRGAVAAGGEKLFCGGRYSGELKRRSASRGWITVAGGVIDCADGRVFADGENADTPDSGLRFSWRNAGGFATGG